MTFLWLFLPALIAIYFLAKKFFPRLRNYILLIFSLLFYAWGEPKYIILMLVSVAMNYVFGLLISKYSTKDKKTKKRHTSKQVIVLAVSIMANLALLGHFKYANFFIDSINNLFGSNFDIGNIALPIGISFYTFQIMSYIIDLYRGEIKVQKNPLKLALYISFFPQLIAGPIVKYKDIDEAIDSRKETIAGFSYGIKRFVYGLFKKVLIADTMAAVADMVFSSDTANLSAPVAWAGAICYFLQIFFDFSGYSDMAIGLGSIFGFRFMENFNLPYISRSITEFWRRWHISLSTWFKEYLYIPLGGNRKGKTRTYINLWIVFLATGIWHGAAWNFVFWGLFHGFFIFVERLGLKNILDKHTIVGHIYTVFIVLVGWVFFRASGIEYALNYLKVMFFGQAMSETPLEGWQIISHKTILIFIVAILFSGIGQVVFRKFKKHDKLEKIYNRYVEPICILLLFTACIMAIANNTYTSFIYFRF